MEKSKVWLIGEHNPYGSDPRYALFPRPKNATGGRLARALGLKDHEYIERFERVNLLDWIPWSVPRAREAAEGIARRIGRSPCVLLGARVSAAFGVEFDPFCEKSGFGLFDHSTRVVVLPHPSGRSRLWNAPDAQQRARDAVEALYAEG
jgi:hypothetical protein